MSHKIVAIPCGCKYVSNSYFGASGMIDCLSSRMSRSKTYVNRTCFGLFGAAGISAFQGEACGASLYVTVVTRM